jgi:hypothetical protein
MDKPDPITKGVEEFIASVPASKLEDKPLMQAFLNWFRSQEVSQDEMCIALCTLLGLFIGARAESRSHMNTGLATYGKQLKTAAGIMMAHKDGTLEV